MAISQTTVTGPVVFPDGSTPTSGKIVFELSQWDKEAGEAVIVPGPFDTDIGPNGEFTLDLFSTADGENGTVYTVSVIYLSTIQTKKEVVLGTVSISGSGPFQLSELPIVGDFTQQPPEVLAEIISYISTMSEQRTALENIAQQNLVVQSTIEASETAVGIAASEAAIARDEAVSARADVLSSKTSVDSSVAIIATANNEVQAALLAIDGSEEAAENSATAAATSAASAEASASNIGSDAQAAETARLAAEAAASTAESEKNSAVAASNTAQQAATAASTSETNSAQAQLTAEGARDDAANSASAASTSESNAASSATSAATEASAANTSRLSAETAESNASASQTAAAQSETNASGSASSASSSATTAATARNEAQASATLAQQAEASTDGKLQSIIAFRVKAGTANGKVELIAADDPSGNATSKFVLDTDTMEIESDLSIFGGILASDGFDPADSDGDGWGIFDTGEIVTKQLFNRSSLVPGAVSQIAISPASTPAKGIFSDNTDGDVAVQLTGIGWTTGHWSAIFSDPAAPTIALNPIKFEYFVEASNFNDDFSNTGTGRLYLYIQLQQISDDAWVTAFSTNGRHGDTAEDDVTISGFKHLAVDMSNYKAARLLGVTNNGHYSVLSGAQLVLSQFNS